MNDADNARKLIAAAQTFVASHDAPTFFATLRSCGSRSEVTRLIEEISAGRHGTLEMPELASLIMIKNTADKVW